MIKKNNEYVVHVQRTESLQRKTEVTSQFYSGRDTFYMVWCKLKTRRYFSINFLDMKLIKKYKKRKWQRLPFGNIEEVEKYVPGLSCHNPYI